MPLRLFLRKVKVRGDSMGVIPGAGKVISGRVDKNVKRFS